MLTDRARDRALDALLAGPVTVGLLAGDREIVSDAYSRQPVRLSLPRPGDRGRRVVNDAEVRFPPMLVETRVTGWLLADAEGEIVREALTPVEYRVNDAPVFRPGGLAVEIV